MHALQNYTMDYAISFPNFPSLSAPHLPHICHMCHNRAMSTQILELVEAPLGCAETVICLSILNEAPRPGPLGKL
jgi:hypothetical protein